MDTQLLKTFLEVKKTRHFGRAAENLYLTQAAVSARIKQLEGTLGCTLFTRYRNNLQLTTAGERLVNHAESMLISWERARADVSLKKNHNQTFSMGATSGLWDLLLQDALNQMHQTQPNVALRAESLSSDILVRRIMERTIDLVLVYEPAKISEVVSLQVSQSELVLVTTQKNTSVEEAINCGFVSVDWGTAFEISFAQALQDLPPPVLHTTLARVAIEFILFHGGSAYLPLRIVNQFLNHSLFLVDSAPSFNRPIYCCHHQENRNTTLIEQMIQIIKTLGES